MACETLAQKSEAPCKAYAAGISSELRASDPEFHEYDCANDLLNPYLDILDLAVGASCGGLRTQDGRELCNALAAGCAGTSGRLAALCAAYRDQDPALCKPADEPPEGLAEGAEYDLHFLGEFGCDMSLAYYRVAKGDSAACSKGGHGNGAGRAFCEAITTNTCTARFERLFEDYGRLDLRLCDGIFDPWIKAQCRAGADAAVLVREDLSHIPS